MAAVEVEDEELELLPFVPPIAFSAPVGAGRSEVMVTMDVPLAETLVLVATLVELLELEELLAALLEAAVELADVGAAADEAPGQFSCML